MGLFIQFHLSFMIHWIYENKWNVSLMIINGNPPIVFLGALFIKPRVSETLIGTPKTPVSDSPNIFNLPISPIISLAISGTYIGGTYHI